MLLGRSSGGLSGIKYPSKSCSEREAPYCQMAALLITNSRLQSRIEKHQARIVVWCCTRQKKPGGEAGGGSQSCWNVLYQDSRRGDFKERKAHIMEDLCK